MVAVYEQLGWRDQIRALRELSDGYAGDGTVAPAPKAIEVAEGLLQAGGWPVAAVLPDGRGGVRIEYRNGRLQCIFEEPAGSRRWWVEFSADPNDLFGRPAVYALS